MTLPADFQFSTSGVSLGMRCPKAWAYRYLDGIRAPEVLWKDVTDATPSRVRSTALGTEVHFALEKWYAGRSYDWSTLPGQIAVSGMSLVPHPQAIYAAESEGKMPPLEFGGISWNGRMDLLVAAHESEWERLKITPYAGVLLSDYKTSADITKYALKPHELAIDLQSNLYGLAVMTRGAMPLLDARWVYMASKRTRRGHPVDTRLERTRAEDIVGDAAIVAHGLAALESSDAAAPNTSACFDYGGCEFRSDLGGPCTAKRSIGAAIQARVRKPVLTTKGITMALDPAAAAALSKFKPAANGPKVLAPVAKPSAPPPAPEPPAEEPAAEAPRGRGRPPGAKNKKAAPAPPPAPEPPAVEEPVAPAQFGKAAHLAELVAALADAEARAEAVCAEVLTIKSAIGAAVSA